MIDRLKKFKEVKIALFGDIFLDRYRITDIIHGASREADIPVLKLLKGKQGHIETYSPGGGGNVAWNLASLGAQVSVFGFIGDDYQSQILKQELENRRINTENLLISKERVTPTYEKTYSVKDLSKPVQRWDNFSSKSLTTEEENLILNKLKENINNFDALIVADQDETTDNLGVITKNIKESLAEISKNIKTFGMSRNNLKDFRNFYCIIPNENELVRAVGNYSPQNFEEKIPKNKVEEAYTKLHASTQTKHIIVTMGKEGALYYDGVSSKHIPTKPLENNIDVTGCGDTFLATLAIADLSGANINEAINLANISAGLTAKKLGTTGTSTVEELIQEIKGGIFFEKFTPLIGSTNQIRAARIYPGGENLDELIGKKTQKEEGWFYPEAWIFSPSPAINPGSKNHKEGQTIIYDKEGNAYDWKEYTKQNRELLGSSKLNITVKLLDGSCTLPKEFHFKKEQEQQLKKYPLLQDFQGTLIKPEVWIRHPTANDEASLSFVGFNKQLDHISFHGIVKASVKEMEDHMNKILINPGEALYIEGGIVHSLGKGLYFEVLADGDLKVTLQDEFAGRKLSLREQVDKLYTKDDNDLYNSLKFIDYSRYGEEILKFSKKIPQGDKIQEIISCPYFSAYWLKIPAKQTLPIKSKGPHIIVTAKGNGLIKSGNIEINLQTKATNFEEFKSTNSCYAAIVHNSTQEYMIENKSDEGLILLQAYPGD